MKATFKIITNQINRKVIINTNYSPLYFLLIHIV